MENSENIWIGRIEDFPIERKMFGSMDTNQLVSRYQGNQSLIESLATGIKLQKSFRKEYYHNHWIQTYTIENRIILIELQERCESNTGLMEILKINA